MHFIHTMIGLFLGLATRIAILRGKMIAGITLYEKSFSYNAQTFPTSVQGSSIENLHRFIQIQSGWKQNRIIIKMIVQCVVYHHDQDLRNTFMFIPYVRQPGRDKLALGKVTGRDDG